MFKITSIFSREWGDVVGYILQTQNSEEYFLCIPIQYWDKFYIGAEQKSASVTITESDGFHIVPCTVDLGNLLFGLKSGDFKLNIYPDTPHCGYIRMDLDCPPSDHGHVIVQHLMEKDRPIPEMLKQLHTEITIPRKSLTPPPNTLLDPNIQYVLDLFNETGITMVGEGIPTHETFTKLLHKLGAETTSGVYEFTGYSWGGKFNAAGELVYEN